MSEKLSSIIISKICSSEISQILKIEEECKLARWSAEGHQQEISSENSIYLTAKHEKDKDIAGFIIARIMSDYEMDVLNFGVLQKYRKHGIGSLLWENLLHSAKSENVTSIWLEVRESNLEAISFYQSKGLVKQQLRKNFYSAPIDNAVLMKLEVEKSKN